MLGFVPIFPVSTIKSFHYIFREELVGIFGATSEQDLGLGVLDKRHLETESSWNWEKFHGVGPLGSSWTRRLEQEQ